MACTLVVVVTSIVITSSDPTAGQKAPDKPPVVEQGDDIVGSIQAQVDT